MTRWLTVAAALLLPVAADAADEGTTPFTPQRDVRPEDRIPKQFEKAVIEQKLDAPIPLDLDFVDERGEAVRLGRYFNDRPVLLVLAYLRCERLCNTGLEGLANRLQRMWRYLPGRDYEVVVVSFDPTDTPEMSRVKKEVFLEWLDKKDAGRAVHFLTGPAEASAALCRAVGFGYEDDPNRPGQFLHASGVIVATPEGRVSKYFLGIGYAEENLRDAIENATKGKIGTVTESILMFCGLYDGTTGKYTVTIMTVVRLAGLLFAVPLIGCLVWHYLKVMKQRPAEA